MSTRQISLSEESTIARDLHLDFVKGVLVLLMVLYHAINYFTLLHPEDLGLRFLTGAFISISGYIVATVYVHKYQLNRRRACLRLIVRGLKLLVIFTAMNLLINLTGIQNYNKAQFDIWHYLNDLSAIYLTGTTSLAAFRILVPISYLLIIAPIYLVLYRFRKAIMLSTIAIVAVLSGVDCGSSILELVMVGLVGLCAGMLAGTSEVPTFRNRLLIVCGLAGCVGAMKYMETYLLTYAVVVLAVQKLLYDFSQTFDLRKPGSLSSWVVLMGQYSLICYIMQIAFLQILFRLLAGQRGGFGYETICITVSASAFILGVCILLRHLRQRSRFIDESYRAVFS